MSKTDFVSSNVRSSIFPTVNDENFSLRLMLCQLGIILVRRYQTVYWPEGEKKKIKEKAKINFNNFGNKKANLNPPDGWKSDRKWFRTDWSSSQQQPRWLMSITQCLSTSLLPTKVFSDFVVKTNFVCNSFDCSATPFPCTVDSRVCFFFYWVQLFSRTKHFLNVSLASGSSSRGEMLQNVERRARK
jgi:hypothetical protein